MPNRLKLIVAYDGSAFEGWQSQAHRNTVQDHLEQAIRKIADNPGRIHGAGRTDAGVHALAQCAHVDLTDRRLTAAKWTGALNALLPPTIRVLRSQYVSRDFHARFSAKGKVYRYRIWAAPILPPLEFNRAWHVPMRIDRDLLKTAAAKFAGTRDFASFAANRGKIETNATRTIRSVRVRGRGPLITIEFDGDGFLYRMVRLMVGAIVEVAIGRCSLAEMTKRLESGRKIGPRFCAPAEGLILIRVWY
jgi:tRNA pseudouridine38-40 synthase